MTNEPSKEVMAKYREHRRVMDRLWEYMLDCALKQMRGELPKIEGGIYHYLTDDQDKRTVGF